MLIIRLQRVGKKKFPTYRVIISEKTKDTWGDYLELLGNFNPHVKENQLNIDAERVKYWISKGAQMSDTISNLLVANKIIEAKKRKSVYLTKRRKTKIEEKNKVKAEAAAKAAPSVPAPASPVPIEEPIAPEATVVAVSEEQKTEPVTGTA